MIAQFNTYKRSLYAGTLLSVWALVIGLEVHRNSGTWSLAATITITTGTMRTITMDTEWSGTHTEDHWLVDEHACTIYPVGILARCKAYPSALREMRKEQLMHARCPDAHVQVSMRQRRITGVNAAHRPGANASFFRLSPFFQPLLKPSPKRRNGRTFMTFAMPNRAWTWCALFLKL